MTRMIKAVVAVLIGISEATASEVIDSCKEHAIAATVTRVTGVCRSRENENSSAQVVEFAHGLFAGHQLQCDTGSDVSIRFCVSRSEKIIGPTQAWYIVPNTPSQQYGTELGPALRLAGNFGYLSVFGAKGEYAPENPYTALHPRVARGARDPCKEAVAVVTEAQGACYVRQNAKGTPERVTFGKQLHSGEELRCNADAHVRMAFCSVARDVELGSEADWLVIPPFLIPPK